MAASLPVAGTDVNGTRDVVLPGVTGLLVPPDDVVALANAVEKLATDGDLRRRLGRAASQRAEQHFSIDATVAAHEALYQEVAAGGQ
jgi:glycosyltransferase involved in cell wall biosynthesis